MRRIRLIAYPVVILLVLTFSMTAFGQAGKGNFKVFERDSAVVEQSKKMRESGSVFSDRNGDGIYDAVKIRGEQLKADIDVANAYGVTYLDGKKVVYYPVANATVPTPGNLGLFGFVHYFDNDGMSIYFAVIIYRLSQVEEEALKQSNKKVVPFSADFVDSNGLRVGVPTFLMLPHSKLTYNAEFQKFNKSSETVLLGTSPSAPSRELFIFHKLPENKDSLMLIHYRWY
jgi:hypothetical protein